MARNRKTSFGRIGLGFGGGHIDCLLDLATGQIERYAGDHRDFPRYGEEPRTDGIHSRLGGKQYYQSRSGCSGAGWIPAKPTLKKLGTYRVDVGGVLLGFRCEDEFTPHVGEFEVYAPFSYRGGDTGDHPVVVRERDGKVTLVPERQLATFLRGEIETESRSFEFKYLKDTNSGEQKRVATIHQPKNRYDQGDDRALRLMVEGFHHEELAFVFPDGWQPEGDGEFWKRLGFRRLPNGLYKVVRNICRYMVDEWVDLAEIQKWVPANVHMLAPHLYVQERDGQYVGVARFEYSGHWYDFESYLEPQAAFRIFAGNREEVAQLERELETGAREKAERERASRAHAALMAHQAAERERIFRELCERFADLDVTIEDSLAAGNCAPGTEDFRQREFPGKRSAKVGQLSRFLAVHGVRRVLEHKLLPLAAEAGLIPAAPPAEITEVVEVSAFRSGLDAPRGEPDDLKHLPNVGPRLEQSLNDLGIFHYWQIVELDETQVLALDRALRLRGRVIRDGWVAAAKSLAGDRQ